MRRFFALSTSLFLACSLLPQHEAAEHQEAVKEFQRFFKTYKQEAQQVEAVMTLKGNECVAAADELVKLLKHQNNGVQQAALAVIATFKEASTFQPWIDSLPKADPETKAMLVKVLGIAKVKAAVPALKQAVAEPKAPPVLKYEVLCAFRRIGDDGVADSVSSLLTDPDPLVRMAAADCVGDLKLVSLRPRIALLVEDPEWQVQTAAINAAGIVRPQEAIQPLINAMKKTGRVRMECANALFAITGYDFGANPEEWQKQWTTLQSIPGWRIPNDEELRKKAESRKKADNFYGKKQEHNTFAKIQTTSTRVLFVIDVSGSMDDLVVERDKFQGYADYKKCTIVKTELLRAIEGLTQDTLFDIVAFATDLNPWKKHLVPANVVNRDAAKAWVQRLQPLGGVDQQDLAQAGLTGSANLSAGKTNTLKALLYAFGVDPDSPVKAAFTGTDKGALKNKLDTVYFLSDGRPSVGKLVDTQEIAHEVRHYNETYRLVIHCIAIGEFQKDFMQSLAHDNGGEFIDMGR